MKYLLRRCEILGCAQCEIFALRRMCKLLAFQISPRGLTALVGMTITSLAAAKEMSVEECVYNMV